MIESYYSGEALGTPSAFLASLLIGCLFGLILERAGFGSSRRLSGVFYLSDMTVIKVMFTALLTAAILLPLVWGLGIAEPAGMFMLPTVYGAAAIGGVLFGVGFVTGGWCPGTAVVGAASGKYDAMLFLFGTLLGSIFFNETFTVISPLYKWGDVGFSLVYEVLGLPLWFFLLAMSLCAWGVFALCTRLEQPNVVETGWQRSPIPVLIAVFVVLSLSLSALPDHFSLGSEDVIAHLEAEKDHVEPVDLARMLIAGDREVLVVDIRTPQEFMRFNIRGAVNVKPDNLRQYLAGVGSNVKVVLYSNGMTHPAQIRDEMHRQGVRNIYMLTDGLEGFKESCLKPVSLRSEPISPDLAKEIGEWRIYFEGRADAASEQSSLSPFVNSKDTVELPSMVSA